MVSDFISIHTCTIQLNPIHISVYLIIGSPKPVFPNDDHKLRFYAMKYCPYAHRIQLVLDFKDIPYHTIHINLTLKPEWLTDVSPLGKVPALEIPEVGNLF